MVALAPRLCTFVNLPKKHLYYNQFFAAFRDSIFVFNEEDKLQLDVYLAEKGSSFDETLKTKPDWIKKRCRRFIPSPPILKALLNALLEEFQKDIYNDPTHGNMPLFNDRTTSEFKKQLEHVEKGCLSDLLDVQLYSVDHVEESGLRVWK